MFAVTRVSSTPAAFEAYSTFHATAASSWSREVILHPSRPPLLEAFGCHDVFFDIVSLQKVHVPYIESRVQIGSSQTFVCHLTENPSQVGHQKRGDVRFG